MAILYARSLFYFFFIFIFGRSFRNDRSISSTSSIRIFLSLVGRLNCVQSKGIFNYFFFFFFSYTAKFFYNFIDNIPSVVECVEDWFSHERSETIQFRFIISFREKLIFGKFVEIRNDLILILSNYELNLHLKFQN